MTPNAISGSTLSIGYRVAPKILVTESDFDGDGIHPSKLSSGGGHEALGFRAATAIRDAVANMV